MRRRNLNPGLRNTFAERVRAAAIRLNVFTEAQRDPGRLPPWAVAEVAKNLADTRKLAEKLNSDYADASAPEGLILLKKAEPGPGKESR